MSDEIERIPPGSRFLLRQISASYECLERFPLSRISSPTCWNGKRTLRGANHGAARLERRSRRVFRDRLVRSGRSGLVAVRSEFLRLLQNPAPWTSGVGSKPIYAVETGARTVPVAVDGVPPDTFGRI